jgi:SAM-dependent methyltransferase
MAKTIDSEAIKAVYEATTTEEVEGAYDGWAARYDRENAELGFRLPSLICGFVARYLPIDAGPILDAGAGTGQVGDGLAVLGYRDLTAIDLSEEMLRVAAGRKVYTDQKRQVLGAPLEFPDDGFAAFVSAGSFGPGHAPPECLDELIRVTRPGGHGVFNVREDTWIDQGYKAKIEALSEAGAWSLLEDSGPFRPYLIGEPDLFTRIFVFEIR